MRLAQGNGSYILSHLNGEAKIMEKEKYIYQMLENWVGEMEIKDELPVPLMTQAQYISKKFDITEQEVQVWRYNPDTDRDQEYNEKMQLIRFKDIIVKYRPHLHMGDYWLGIYFVNKRPMYRFYYKETFQDREVFMKAFHPHLSNGIPCFGSHQGDINSAITTGNFMRFLSQIKQYLTSYYGRSTYQRGSHWRKHKICYQLHSMSEIQDIFAPESDDPDNLDYYGIACDKTRWNFPKDLTAWGSFIVEGQEGSAFLSYIRPEPASNRNVPTFDHSFPYFDNRYQRWDSFGTHYHNDVNTKLMGYIYLAMELGEMSLLQATEFVRIFICKLFAEYSGNLTAEVMQQLKEMSNQLNRDYGADFTVTRRYKIRLSSDDEKEKEILKRQLNDICNGNVDKFVNQLKYAGNKIGQFIVLLRKMKPHAATCKSFINGELVEADVQNYADRFNHIENIAYRKAIELLEKDRRKIINGINKTKTINTSQNGEQESLFSENV
tara:strand:+ start:1450 stop:2928 length:1479 start_codon:yes stop_codon:yes gene_type:complete